MEVLSGPRATRADSLPGCCMENSSASNGLPHSPPGQLLFIFSSVYMVLELQSPDLSGLLAYVMTAPVLPVTTWLFYTPIRLLNLGTKCPNLHHLVKRASSTVPTVRAQLSKYLLSDWIHECWKAITHHSWLLCCHHYQINSQAVSDRIKSRGADCGNWVSERQS